MSPPRTPAAPVQHLSVSGLSRLWDAWRLRHRRRYLLARAIRRRRQLRCVADPTAAIRPGDMVLEPSAGTGLLAIQAETRGASLVLNELAEIRAEMLAGLFGDCPITRHDAALVSVLLACEVVPDADDGEQGQQRRHRNADIDMHGGSGHGLAQVVGQRRRGG